MSFRLSFRKLLAFMAALCLAGPVWAQQVQTTCKIDPATPQVPVAPGVSFTLNCNDLPIFNLVGQKPLMFNIDQIKVPVWATKDNNGVLKSELNISLRVSGNKWQGLNNPSPPSITLN